jgi:hypothetical protein
MFKQAQQIQILVFSQSLYFIYYNSVRPFNSQAKKKLDMFNEFMILIAFYHLFLFTMWSIWVCNLTQGTDENGVDLEISAENRPRWPYQLQDHSGTSFSITIIFVVGVNVVLMMRNNFLSAKRKRELL